MKNIQKKTGPGNTNLAELPDELTRIAHWSVHRNKVPKSVGGKLLRLPLAEAEKLLNNGNTGLSFDFKDTPYAYSDLDTYKDIADKALHQELIDIACADTYVEVSMSGQGHHIVYRGEQYASAKGIDNKGKNLLFMTGDSIGCPDVGELSKNFIKASGFKPAAKKVDSDGKVEPTDIAKHTRAILTGENYNDSLCSLSASFASNGLNHKQVVQTLDGIMDACQRKDKRWRDRKKHIPIHASTALKKFAATAAIETSAAKQIKVISCADLLSREFPPRENLLSPWLPKQAVTLVHASRGVGKTHISIGVTCAVVTGSTFLKWKAGRPAGCLFIDGEMPAVVLQERFAQTIAMMDGDGEATLNIITPDMQGDHGMLDLATLEGQQRLEPYITDDIELIVVDNISTICRSTQENRGDTWLPMQEWALRMRARGKSVLLVHHDGKGGQQRGTSRKEDILDTVIQLKKPTDYTPDKGALFEVHFRKNRGIYGDDVTPFEAQLMDMGEGLLGWATRDIEDSMKDKVKKFLADGYAQKDIAEELKITKGYVSKLCRKIKLET